MVDIDYRLFLTCYWGEIMEESIGYLWIQSLDDDASDDGDSQDQDDADDAQPTNEDG